MPVHEEHIYWLCPHSIVEASDGQLIDVTPQNDPTIALRFLRDDSDFLRDSIRGGVGYYQYPLFEFDAVSMAMGEVDRED